MKSKVYSRNQHCISRRNIDPDALKIIHRLVRHGFKAYLVGGSVRDLLLNKRPKDFDIATDATPRKVKTLFRNCRIIGRRFKLAHIFFHNNKIIEVSTFRDISVPINNGKTLGQPERLIIRDNTFGTEATDALRRDITINALYYDPVTFSIIDYVGGIKDLQEGIIRIIGDPDERFQEDPVRMLRAVRHAARNDFTLDRKCREALARNRELLLQVAPMRIFDELKKDLCSGSAAKILALLGKTDLLQLFLPELIDVEGELLRPESDFLRTLAFADTQVAAGKQIASTDLLTLIALYASKPSVKKSELGGIFADQSGIINFMHSCFAKLAVPRRERESITATLLCWFKVVNTAPADLQPGKLSRNPYFGHLLTLLRLTGSSPALLRKLERPQARRGDTATRGQTDKNVRRKGSRTGPGGKTASLIL